MVVQVGSQGETWQSRTHGDTANLDYTQAASGHQGWIGLTSYYCKNYSMDEGGNLEIGSSPETSSSSNASFDTIAHIKSGVSRSA